MHTSHTSLVGKASSGDAAGSIWVESSEELRRAGESSSSRGRRVALDEPCPSFEDKLRPQIKVATRGKSFF